MTATPPDFIQHLEPASSPDALRAAVAAMHDKGAMWLEVSDHPDRGPILRGWRVRPPEHVVLDFPLAGPTDPPPAHHVTPELIDCAHGRHDYEPTTAPARMRRCRKCGSVHTVRE